VGDGKLIIISMTVSSINDSIRFYMAGSKAAQGPVKAGLSERMKKHVLTPLR